MSSSTITPANSRLYKPLKVGHADLQHRVVLAPLTRNRNDADNTPLPFMAKYYADRASIPGTLVISEATGISAPESGQAHTPGFHSDAQVAAWREIVSAVHAKGSFYFQQLWALGRAAEHELQAARGFRYRSASAVPLKIVFTGEMAPAPEAMTEDDIQEIISDYAAAARRAVFEAGADGVEIHGAHGYLLDQFLSDAVNQRTDAWGGSVEKRSRLLLEVVKAVVKALDGDASRVAIRLSPFAHFQGAIKGDIHAQYCHVIKELKAMNLPFAYLSLVEATGDPAHIVMGTDQPNKGKTLGFLLEEWDNTSPVIVAGGYKPETAAQMLETYYGKWDNVLVAFGRLYLANPDFVFRVKEGLPLNDYDRSTFYEVMSEKGYNDYPFSDEFLQQQKQAEVKA